MAREEARIIDGVTVREPLLELADRFTHVAYIGDRVVVIGDEDPVVLELPIVRDVIRLLDGSRTAVGIAHELEDRHPPAVVHFALLALMRSGIVRATNGHAPSRTGDAAPWGDGSAAAMARRLRDAWERRRTASYVRISIGGSAREPVQLILADDYLSPDVAGIEIMGPTVLVRVGPGRFWAGPAIVPGVGPCLACLRERLQLNLSGRALLQRHGPEDSDGIHVVDIERATPAGVYVRLAVSLHGILDELAAGSPRARIEVIPLDGSEKEVHTVIRLPHCTACGDPSLTVPGATFELRPRHVNGRSGGGYRMLDPAETLRRFSHHISPLTGVVRHVRSVPVDGTDLVHVYTSRHALHHGTASVRTLKSVRRDPSGGKGATDLDARVSALCESLERCSGVHRGNEPVRTARLSQLGRQAVPPNEILLYSDGQFAEREARNALDASGFQWVPEPYDDHPIEWAEARSLSTGETRHVPAACLYLDFKGDGRRFARGDSNGLAGGNCLEEAILQGFFELVERDAVALWWYNRLNRPALDLESFENPWIDRVRDYYGTLSLSIWALDLTTDLQVPCFAALSHRLDETPQDIIFGFGCHLDARIALVRALTELNQMLPTIQRSPDERRRQLLPEFEDAIRWWDTARIEEHPYLCPAEAIATKVADFPPPTSRDLRGHVLVCVDRARAVGCDFLVHDLTRPDIGFAVARVLVPGLRHFWRRLGPGRLYDVPARLGWVVQPRDEASMNPVSMFV